MMSNIKDKKKNNDNKVLKYFQNIETIIRQKSNVTFEKTIQSEKKNNNKKTFSHEISKNNIINYITFIEKT